MTYFIIYYSIIIIFVVVVIIIDLKKIVGKVLRIFRGQNTDSGHVSFSAKRIGFSVTVVLGKIYNNFQCNENVHLH